MTRCLAGPQLLRSLALATISSCESRAISAKSRPLGRWPWLSRKLKNALNTGAIASKKEGSADTFRGRISVQHSATASLSHSPGDRPRYSYVYLAKNSVIAPASLWCESLRRANSGLSAKASYHSSVVARTALNCSSEDSSLMSLFIRQWTGPVKQQLLEVIAEFFAACSQLGFSHLGHWMISTA